ncbi:MAG: hypothetical protein H7Z14_04990 [Anaerolineae bacterium]|nr:hypothetical protein [Phycisphaerae bacterium]
MSEPLGFQSRKVEGPQRDKIEHVIVQRPLQRVLAFTRRTIDDVINDPIARNEVRGYFKLYKLVQRGSEVVELEKQWNSI